MLTPDRQKKRLAELDEAKAVFLDLLNSLESRGLRVFQDRLLDRTGAP